MRLEPAAWARRAGVAAAIVAGLLATAATPVHAQGGDVKLEGISGVELSVGDAETVAVVATNDAEEPAVNVEVTMTVPLADIGLHIADYSAGGATCDGDDNRLRCTIATLPGKSSWNASVRLAVDAGSPLAPRDSRSGKAEVRLGGIGYNDTESFNVKVNGPEEPPGVKEISGRVTDIDTGEPIPGATVLLVDGAGADHQVGTNNAGEFRFTDDIAPGAFGLMARKDGYEPREYTDQAEAGAEVTGIQLVVKDLDGASPTASPSATPSGEPSASATATVAAAAAEDDSGSGGTFFTTLMVVLGSILLLSGLAAIGFMIWRRFRGDEDDYGDADDPTSGPRGPMPRPGSHGVYRPSPTQVIGGAPTQVMGDARTQVIRPGSGAGLPAVGPRPALADAPTMMHGAAGGEDATTRLPRQGPGGPGAPGGPTGPRPPRPPAPDHGQPRHGAAAPPPGGPAAYGSPVAPGSGYGGSGRYGSTAAPGYGPGGGGGPVPEQPTHGGYGPDPYTTPPAPPPAPPSGYERSGYDGGRHSAPSQPGYRDPGYGESRHGDPGYGQPRGYGQGTYDQSGHPGYDQSGHPGYDQSGHPGYAQPGHVAESGQPGYGEPGYGEPGYGEPGYGAHGSGYGQPGYGSGPVAAPDQHGHYQDQGGHQEQPPPRRRHADPPERRRLDWLDD